MRPATRSRHDPDWYPRGETTRVPAVTAFPSQHCNAITSWSIERGGEVKHVYA
jgi:hypothetical protein